MEKRREHASSGEPMAYDYANLFQINLRKMNSTLSWIFPEFYNYLKYLKVKIIWNPGFKPADLLFKAPEFCTNAETSE